MKKVWFKWTNDNVQKVYIYKEFRVGNETWYRAKRNNINFVLKQKDYGKTWALTKEELE